MILVTGCNGYVASHLLPSLSQDDMKFIGYDAIKDPLTMMEEVRPLINQSEVIIHMGAMSNNQSGKDVYIYNTSLSAFIFSASHNKPVLNFSSFIAVEVGGTRDKQSHYAKSKRYAERIGLEHDNVTSIRPGVVWGREMTRTPSRRSLPYRLLNDELEHFFPDWWRNYVHVDDLIAVIKEFVNNPAVFPKVFQLSDKDMISSDWFASYCPTSAPVVEPKSIHRFPTSMPIVGDVPMVLPSEGTKERFIRLVEEKRRESEP